MRKAAIFPLMIWLLVMLGSGLTISAQAISTVLVKYFYDVEGRLSRVQYGSVTAIHYLYDRANNLTNYEIIAGTPPNRTLSANYTSGQQGSYFTIQGGGFAPNSWVRLSINQVPLSPLIQCDGSGSFEVVLFFDMADSGLYVIEAMPAPDPGSSMSTREATAAIWPSWSIFIGPNGAFRSRSSQSTLFTIPAGFAVPPLAIHLPIIGRSEGPSPPPSSALRFWLQADQGVSLDVSNRVTQWQDQSGNNFHVTSPGSGSWTAPAFIAQATPNSLPAVRFTAGLSTLLRTLSAIDLMQGAKDFSLFIVVKPGTSQPTYADILDYNHASCRNIVVQQSGSTLNRFGDPAQQLDSGKFQVLTYAFNNTDKIAYSALDGANRLSGSTCTAGYTYLEPSVLTLGGNLNYTTRLFNGDIVEIRIYNKLLTTAEMQTIEGELKTRYGL